MNSPTTSFGKGRTARRSTSEAFALIVASLQRGPKSREELIQGTRLSDHTVRRFLVAMRNYGAVYVTQKRATKRRPVNVFALSPAPFLVPDATAITDAKEGV